MKRLPALLWCAALSAIALAARADGPTECDRLAAHPSDPDKVLEGVSSAAVRGWNDAAIWACREALRHEPGNARVRYQLGRALFYDGQEAEALGHLETAASAKHRQAQFVYGLMYTNGVDGILAADACKALALWEDAAARGHFASRIALGRDWARGRYAGCEQVPDAASVDGWLATARSETTDYYQQLLIDWAREVIAAGR